MRCDNCNTEIESDPGPVEVETAYGDKVFCAPGCHWDYTERKQHAERERADRMAKAETYRVDGRR